MTPGRILARLCLVICTLLIAIGAGYLWGATATTHQWTARLAKATARVSALELQLARQADQAAADFLTAHTQQEARYAALDQLHRKLLERTPLVVRTRAPGPAAVCGRGGEPATRSTEPAGATGPNAEAQRGIQLPDLAAGVPDEPELTLAAVRVWNGALTGRDAPAGACGAAGAAAGADSACSEGSGLSLGDAWLNHAANAKACAEDRQRYRHLIDLLAQQDSQTARER